MTDKSNSASFSSRYPKMEPEEIRAHIPQHILDRLPDDERFLVESVSRLEQHTVWLQAVADHHIAYIQSIDQRLQTMEKGEDAVHTNMDKVINQEIKPKLTAVHEWKIQVMSKWALIAGVAVLVVPSAVKALADWYLKKP